MHSETGRLYRESLRDIRDLWGWKWGRLVRFICSEIECDIFTMTFLNKSKGILRCFDCKSWAVARNTREKCSFLYTMKNFLSLNQTSSKYFSIYVYFEIFENFHILVLKVRCLFEIRQHFSEFSWFLQQSKKISSYNPVKQIQFIFYFYKILSFLQLKNYHIFMEAWLPGRFQHSSVTYT